jgi:hypothetical protein
MRIQGKATQLKKNKSIARKSQCKSMTARPPERSVKNVSRAMKNKIWHNWLAEENYL